MKKYDVIVIGSGGGAKITSPAARMGLKVAVLEKDALGGTCLNRGCIPSKMLIHPAEVATQIAEAEKFDISVGLPVSVDFDRLIKRISETVDHDSSQIASGYERNPNIDFYHAAGRFVSNKVIRINDEEITADKIFIAVGARPFIPDIPGLKGTPFMTSTEALRNPRLPRKLIVIGGSYIAVELGYAYAALGCEVTFLVRSHLVKHEDADVASEFQRVFSEHYDVRLGAVSQRVDYCNHQFTVTYSNLGTKDLVKVSADALLVAAGVVPNNDLLGLENTDIKVRHGFICVDEYLRTSVDGIYAMGDCVGKYMFRHSVNFEGEYLFRTVFEKKNIEPIKYPPVPHAVFTHPQIAGVGKTEQELQLEGVDYVAGVNAYAKSAMGMARLSDHGFVKILIERKTRKILGAHIIGDEASDMIHMLIAFMCKDGTLDDLLNMIYIHPALPEIVRNAARKAQAEIEKRAQSTSAPGTK